MLTKSNGVQEYERREWKRRKEEGLGRTVKRKNMEEHFTAHERETNKIPYLNILSKYIR